MTYILLSHGVVIRLPFLLVNVIFIISHERLFSDLNREFTPASGIVVVKLSKSGGVVNRDHTFRKARQSQKVREYFYGNPDTALGRADLNPYSTTVSYTEIAVHRVGEGEDCLFIFVQRFLFKFC